MSSKSYQPIAPQRVAFLVLGTMGAPMAMHLARAGHEVCVYNRSAAKAQAWSAEHGGRHVHERVERGERVDAHARSGRHGRE